MVQQVHFLAACIIRVLLANAAMANDDANANGNVISSNPNANAHANVNNGCVKDYSSMFYKIKI
jgi:hypothetical protein